MVVCQTVLQEEIVKASQNGTLEEAFGTGTAVGIAYIQAIGMDDETIHISDACPVGKEINDALNDIKTGRIDDIFNWMVKIENQLA